MKKKISAGILALVFLLQAFLPSLVYANQANPQDTKIISEGTKGPDNVVTIGKLKGVGFSKDNPTASISIEEVKEKKHKNTDALDGLEISDENIPQALRSAGSPYINGSQPADPDKPKYWANVKGELTTVGIDGGSFDWDKIFGQGAKVKLLFTQTNGNVMTGVTYSLLVDKDGTYTWQGSDGKPTYLPLYDANGKPYTYNVQIERNYGRNVQLIIQESNGTPKSQWRQEGDKQVATISFLDIKIQQVASTKFVSEWHTGVNEADRPQIEGYFKVDDETDNDFNFPKNDTTRTILRSSFVENFEEDEDKGPWSFLSSELETTPKTVEVKTDTQGLTFEENNGVKTVKSGDHKYKYDFTYDVINGGKLTMTEVLPVTFDANGGKFANFTAPDTETKIAKEVEYDGTLTDKAENPKKDRETFKGWSETKGGTTPVSDDFFKNIKEAKTLYAIWDNNAIVADQLEVQESFKDGDTWVNDFIPTLDQLKGQVKIKDVNGDPQALEATDTFAIVDGSNEYTADGDALKNYLYGKLQEKGNPKDEPTRIETVKAKITHQNGTSQTVDIPIKVIKNIYEAKTLTKKPFYVPDGYVKVTLDPTTKAKEPQKYFYYVNPKAKVLIPGNDPTGTDDNKFVKWTSLVDGSAAETKPSDFDLAKRHQFEKATTITAQYVSDVIPQEGTEKPDTVPKNYVEVKFVPTDKATNETKAEKIYWVNPDKKVTIPVTNPKGATYYTFKEWKIGDVKTGKTYTVGTPKQFTDKNGTTITATYDEAKNIISYDPSVPDPMVRPEGYVRVTFAADEGLKLTEQKAYYVKKNAGITLANTELGKPAYKAETSYKFDKWDKEDSLVIEAADIVVTAKATKLDNVIPERKEDGTPNEKPEGYKEVTFVVKTGDEAKGSITGVAKFYVNPTEYVKINPPETKANTGYEFGAWDKDTTIPKVYKEDETITGSFNGLKDVIPKTKTDESEKPKGYVTVTFELEKLDGKEAGKIVDGETITYFVKPNTDVTIPRPKILANTGYEFINWNPDTSKNAQYSEDKTVKGSFKKLDDIISYINDKGKPTAKPDGYVTVVFDKGAHGSLTGVKTYYVNPVAKKTMGELKKKAPKVTPETGYEFTSWSRKDEEVITEDSDEYIITAQYKDLDDVIPQKKTDGTDKPNGYITVTFSTETNGKVKDTTDTKTKVVYVNPNKAVALDSFAPKVTPNTGYDFADWDTQIDKKIQYSNGDTIKALYNKKGTVIPQEKTDGSDKPEGYFTVTFDKGDHGTLSGKTVYYVNPNESVTVPAPTVTPATGWTQKTGDNAWDKALTQTFTADTTITAQYEALKDKIPQENSDGSDKPNGYKVVKFVGVHGSLSEPTVYYVNPDKEVDFTSTAKAFTKTPDFAYTADGGTWNSTEFKKKFTADETFTFTFKELDNVIPEKENGNTNTQPKGYVKVTLIPTNKATDATNKVYFVNPKETVQIKNKPVGKEVTDANGSKSSFKFIGWTVTRGTIKSWSDENITDKFIQDTEITAKYEFDWINIVKEPIAGENVVTGKGDKPNPEDLIKNKYDKDDPTNNNNLPKGTTFTYEEEPKVDQVGNITAKVKVEYPSGATTIVEVPITVVDHVVPQVGNPLVPANYVKVTVDTTDKATDNTQFKKVFWVKPNVEVTIDEVKNPTGKEETIGDVTKTNKFVKWQRQGATPDKFYETEIKDIFAEKTETTIVAVYEQDENVAPKPNNNLDVPQGSKPNAKDFINNVYNDNDPKNKDNLPPGTKLEFVPGQEPNTKDLGQDKQTTIKVIYPNGETKTVNVKYNVTNDVAEQEKGKDKPAVPADFVKVTVDTTDKATDQTKFERTFWVNPKKQVTIPVDNPIGKVGENDDGKIVQWKFTDWNKSLTGTFKKETTITAQYEEVTQVPGSVGYLVTDEGVQPTAAQYKDRIQPPEGKKIAEVELVEQPDVSKPGVSTAKLKVTYSDGTSSEDVTMTVFVQGKPQGDWQTGTLGSTRILTVVEKEVVKVPAEKTFRKEVRYMQGFNNYFRPTEGLTRAEAAQILANALVEDGYRYDPNFTIRYKDIVGNEWYAKAIRITSQANVFKGYDTGYFDPHKKITRAEWIGTLRRFQELERAPGNHMQVRPDHWAMGEIEAAYKEGWLAIYGQGLARFNADEFIPRQEVAAVSNKAFNRVLDKTYIHRNSKNLINYKDVNPSMWSYEDILCASNGYLHDGKSFWGHKIDYKKDLYNINLDGYTVTKDKFQRLERR